MKRRNRKWITLMLAGVCAASLSVATAGVITTAAEEEAKSTYTATEIFGRTNDATIGEEGSETKYVAFTLGNKADAEAGDIQTVNIKRNVALKWFTAKNTAAYFTAKFAVKDLSNVSSITVKMESENAAANKDDKAVNSVKFIKETDGSLSATVINESGEQAKTPLTGIVAGTDITLSLSEGSAFGCFKVSVNGTELNGEFTNVGANYAEYTADKMNPIEISAVTENDGKAVVVWKEINGQSFELTDGKITDKVAPVLVVNEEVDSFQYGTGFALDYTVVDVLQNSSFTETKKFYQFNPADAKPSITSDLSTYTNFLPMTYYTKEDGTGASKTKEGEFVKATTVSRSYDADNDGVADGNEYMAVEFTLKDKVGENTFDLAWYASKVQKIKLSEEEGEGTEYIIIDQNEEGPAFTHIVKNDGATKQDYSYKGETGDTAKNVFEADVTDYESKIANKIADDEVMAGSDSKLALPSLDWLIKDNGGYQGIRYTISYKTPTSTSPKTSSRLAYNSLKISTTEEGIYEFKVFATDKAGNSMQYYLENELVEVTTDNVWDIEEIPTFVFEIADAPIKVEEGTTSSKKTEKVLDQTYSLSGLKVVGATNQLSEYKLYKIDTSACEGLTSDVLTSINYESIRTKANAADGAIATGDVGEGKTYSDYFDLYLNIYAELLAEKLSGVEKATVLSCLKNGEINEYNANITETDEEEWEAYNKYNWDPAAKSFKAAEEGTYLILADFCEDHNFASRATAYKIIVVESKADVVTGDSKFSEWVKNNVVSVILFGVAGLMLIAIIVLLLIKPSDETLEDIDKKVEEKSKKNKEEKSE